jgi:hypothetical protein
MAKQRRGHCFANEDDRHRVATAASRENAEIAAEAIG